MPYDKNITLRKALEQVLYVAFAAFVSAAATEADLIGAELSLPLVALLAAGLRALENFLKHRKD